MSSRLTWFYATCCALLLAGCGGTASQPAHLPQTEPAPVASPAQPAVPVPFPDERTVSSAETFVSNGSDAFAFSVGSTIQSTSMHIPGTPWAPGYAIYRLNLGSSEPLSLTVTLAAADNAYLGLADFTAQHWDFSGPYGSTTDLPLDPNTNVSPLGNIYVAVLVEPASPSLSATVSKLQAFPHDWQQMPSPEAAHYAEDNSVAIVDGNPAISYYFDSADGHAPELRYVRATAPDGSAWGNSLTLDVGQSLGQPVGAGNAMAVVDGCPAISYVGNNGALMYMRAADADGTTWGAPQMLDPNGGETRLAVVAGCPAIVFGKATYVNGTLDHIALKYMRATTSTGDTASDWGQPVTVYSDVDGGWGQGFAVVDGNPAISFGASANGCLRYVRASTATGDAATDWNAVVVVDPAAYTVGPTSLVVVAGAPAIAYEDFTDLQLKFARATTAIGQTPSEWVLTDIPVQGQVQNWLSLAEVDGRPAISFNEYGGGGPNPRYESYVRAFDSAGSHWGPKLDLANGGRGTLYVVEGRPAIAYQSDADGTLQFIRAN
jgi:hypothetical protein